MGQVRLWLGLIEKFRLELLGLELRLEFGWRLGKLYSSLLKEMIDEADRDNDGEINEAEFLRIMKKTSLYWTDHFPIFDSRRYFLYCISDDSSYAENQSLLRFHQFCEMLFASVHPMGLYSVLTRRRRLFVKAPMKTLLKLFHLIRCRYFSREAFLGMLEQPTRSIETFHWRKGYWKIWNNVNLCT